MTGTMTWVGLDVHARSTHAAAIDVVTEELTRARFGAGSDDVVGWLSGLRAPERVVCDAGPTGFALYRAAHGARRDRGDRPEQDDAAVRRPGRERSQGR